MSQHVDYYHGQCSAANIPRDVGKHNFTTLTLHATPWVKFLLNQIDMCT